MRCCSNYYEDATRRCDKTMRQEMQCSTCACKQAKKAILGLSGFLLGISAGGFCTSRQRF